MQNSPYIRRMCPADLDQIVAIEIASFSSPWSAVMLAAAMGFSDSFNFVLESEKKIYAYIFSKIKREELHIINLAVHPEKRRQGLGVRLLRFTIGRASDRGAIWAHLEVRTSNLVALRLYQKEGFRVIRMIPRYYEDGSDALEMGLSISQ